MPRRNAAMRLVVNNRRRQRDDTEFEKLFELGPYTRNQVTARQIDQLRALIDEQGSNRAAQEVGVSTETLLRVTSGFGHTLKPKTAALIRAFLAGD